jgi:hypothetical protein
MNKVSKKKGKKMEVLLIVLSIVITFESMVIIGISFRTSERIYQINVAWANKIFELEKCYEQEIKELMSEVEGRDY